MKNPLKFVVFSTLTFLLFVENVSHGYEYGPIIDRIIVYGAQFPYFFKSHSNATKIGNHLANNKPYPNVPQYPLSDRNVPFYLYTRKNPNPDVPQILFVGDSREKLLLAGFNPYHETVMFCHGFLSTFDEFVLNFTTSLLPRGDVNIILVVWDSYSFFDVTYTEAVTLFKLGDVIARFVQTLIDGGADRKNMNLIGHSDGAGALSLAAKKIHPRIGRLTLFDPVGDYFNLFLSPPNQIVSITDADYVQIVHCSVNRQGLTPQVKGDITFYMNDALIQPQCVEYTDVSSIALCSHDTCLSYMVESLQKNSSLVGIKCAGFLSNAPKDYDFSDKVILTYDVPTNIKGKYCVRTDSPPPPNIEYKK